MVGSAPLEEGLPGASFEDVPDGKIYLDAAAAAGDRSRNIIYFILILVVLTFTSIKNNYSPDWMSHRADFRQDLYKCLYANNIDLDDCQPLREKAKKANYSKKLEGDKLSYDIIGLADRMGYRLVGQFGTADFLEKNKFVIGQIKRDAILYAKRDIEIQTIAIPLLGSWIDINDLWLISGGLMMFLLYLLGASLEQEYRNLQYILAKKRAFIDIAVMHQVLSVLSVRMNPFAKVVECFVWLIPTLLYLWVAYLDYTSYQVGVLLLGDWTALPEFATAALVGYFNVTCWLSHLKIRNLMSPLLQAALP